MWPTDWPTDWLTDRTESRDAIAFKNYHIISSGLDRFEYDKFDKSWIASPDSRFKKLWPTDWPTNWPTDWLTEQNLEMLSHLKTQGKAMSL